MSMYLTRVTKPFLSLVELSRGGIESISDLDGYLSRGIYEIRKKPRVCVGVKKREEDK